MPDVGCKVYQADKGYAIPYKLGSVFQGGLHRLHTPKQTMNARLPQISRRPMFMRGSLQSVRAIFRSSIMCFMGFILTTWAQDARGLPEKIAS